MSQNKKSTALRNATVASVFILFISFLPFIILGERSYFTIMDCLDSNYVWLHILKITGQKFSFSTNEVIPNIMNGLPRSVFGSGIHIVNFIFYIFNPTAAYIINYILTHLVGFAGMYLLLRKHILKEDQEHPAAIICALIYSIIPFYSIYGACVPYQPLLLFAFLNLLKEKKNHWVDYLIILAFPLYTYTTLVGLFALISLGVLFIIKSLTDRKINKRYLLGLCLLFAGMFLYDSPLLYQTLFNHSFSSTRTEINRAALLTKTYFWTVIDDSILNLCETQDHAGHFFTYPILIASTAAACIVIFYKRYSSAIIYLIASVIIIGVFSAAYIPLCGIFGTKIPLIRAFQFDRFYFLIPTIWVILFAFSIKELFAYEGLKLFIWFLIITQLTIVFFCNREYKINLRFLAHHKYTEPNCRDYYDTDLFAAVAKYIGKPQKDYRVVSLALSPTIAQYNGFYTLDGYQPVYDLNYKHQFRKVIASELVKDSYLQTYFDKWGSRCYMYTPQLKLYRNSREEVMYSRDSTGHINNPAFNYGVLKDMGCQYIISSVKIDNFDPQVLSLEKEFDDKKSFWVIYLYKIL